MPSFCRAEELQGFNSERILGTVFTSPVFLQLDSPYEWESGERELVWGMVCPLASACCTKDVGRADSHSQPVCASGFPNLWHSLCPQMLPGSSPNVPRNYE